MNWIVHVQNEAAKQLSAIPPDRRKRILDDISVLQEDPFRKGKYRKVSGRYRIIFRPIHAKRTVEVLAVFLRNEATYK